MLVDLLPLAPLLDEYRCALHSDGQIDTTRPEMTFCVKIQAFPLSDQILELSGKSS